MGGTALDPGSRRICVGDAAGSELTFCPEPARATGQAHGRRGQSATSPVSRAESGLINVVQPSVGRPPAIRPAACRTAHKGDWTPAAADR